MESLQQVFYQRGLGQRLAALIVTAIMVPLSQVPLPWLGSVTCTCTPIPTHEVVLCGSMSSGAVGPVLSKPTGCNIIQGSCWGMTCHRVLIVGAQVRGMEDVSFCSIIGIAGMLLALVIAAAKLCVLRVDDYAPTHWLRKCAHRVSRHRTGCHAALLMYYNAQHE